MMHCRCAAHVTEYRLGGVTLVQLAVISRWIPHPSKPAKPQVRFQRNWRHD